MSLADEPAPTPLAGLYQHTNAAIAAAVASLLGIAPDFAGTVHPGRFERAGDLILDGAHNPHGARALADTLRSLGVRPVLVIAASADKPLADLARALEPAVSHVIATRYQQERSASPDELARHFAHAETAPDLEHAVARARALGSTVLIAGSLFLVGEARVRYLGAPADPVFVTDPSAGPAGSAAPPPTTSP